MVWKRLSETDSFFFIFLDICLMQTKGTLQNWSVIGVSTRASYEISKKSPCQHPCILALVDLECWSFRCFNALNLLVNWCTLRRAYIPVPQDSTGGMLSWYSAYLTLSTCAAHLPTLLVRVPSPPGWQQQQGAIMCPPEEDGRVAPPITLDQKYDWLVWPVLSSAMVRFPLPSHEPVPIKSRWT